MIAREEQQAQNPNMGYQTYKDKEGNIRVNLVLQGERMGA
jgi:hypothetical protein